jgi:hypothetical protein
MRRLCLLMAIAGLAVLAPPASGAASHFPVPLSFSDTIPCNGFTVSLQVEGTLRITIVPLPDGTTLEVDAISGTATFTNTTSGKTLVSPQAGVNRIITSEDGAQTIYTAGILGLLTLPGEGPVLLNVGRIVMTIDAAGDVEVISESGQHPTGAIRPLICAALA